MESLRNRQDIRLVNNENKAEKLITKPNFKTKTVSDNNIVATHVQEKRGNDQANLPDVHYPGALETIMNDFVHGYIKPRYGSRAKLKYVTRIQIV